jgi:anthranilate phosphoribosyltransferase
VGLSPEERLAPIGGVTGALDALASGRDLTLEQAEAVMDLAFDGTLDPVVVSGLLVALRAKGESVDELTGMVRSMVDHATGVVLPAPAMDIVGTGGDGLRTINVSTIAAIVVAGAGVKVCKHGNRAASSSVGTADVLEELGVAIEATPETVAACVEEAGMGFCFAQTFHPAMRFVGPVRRALGIRTAFNFLGPLSNPSRPDRLLLGTADGGSAVKMAEVLGANGVTRAWVVHSEDGLDELSLSAPASVVEVVGDGQGEYELSRWSLDPSSAGFRAVPIEAIQGGDAATNAAVVRSVLAGESGAAREIILLNAAAALVVAEVASSIEDGAEQAGRAIDEGRAAAVLERLIATSRR